jgi:hypothetical protein
LDELAAQDLADVDNTADLSYSGSDIDRWSPGSEVLPKSELKKFEKLLSRIPKDAETLAEILEVVGQAFPGQLLPASDLTTTRSRLVGIETSRSSGNSLQSPPASELATAPAQTQPIVQPAEQLTAGKWVERVTGTFAELLPRRESAGFADHLQDLHRFFELVAIRTTEFRRELLPHLKPLVESVLKTTPADLKIKREVSDLVNGIMKKNGLAFEGRWENEPRSTACSVQLVHADRGEGSSFVLRERTKAAGHTHKRVSKNITTTTDLKFMIVNDQEVANTPDRGG